jgi:hypothetical protein
MRCRPSQGAALGNMYEGQVKGWIKLRLRYLPIAQLLGTSRDCYKVMYLAERTGFDSSAAVSTTI